MTFEPLNRDEYVYSCNLLESFTASQKNTLAQTGTQTLRQKSPLNRVSDIMIELNFEPEFTF